MSQRDDSTGAAFGLLVIIAFLAVGGIYGWSRSIGADFATTLGAIGRSIACLGLVGVGLYFGREYISPWAIVMFGAAGLVWIWSDVVESILIGGGVPGVAREIWQEQLPWWFTWGRGLLIAGLAGGGIWVAIKDRRY